MSSKTEAMEGIGIGTIMGDKLRGEGLICFSEGTAARAAGLIARASTGPRSAHPRERRFQFLRQCPNPPGIHAGFRIIQQPIKLGQFPGGFGIGHAPAPPCLNRIIRRHVHATQKRPKNGRIRAAP